MLTTFDSCARPRYIEDLWRTVGPQMQPLEALESYVNCSDFPTFLGRLKLHVAVIHVYNYVGEILALSESTAVLKYNKADMVNNCLFSDREGLGTSL